MGPLPPSLPRCSFGGCAATVGRMTVHYLCDSCGHRGVDHAARTADEVLCEVCGEPVLQDPDVPRDSDRDD